MWHARTWKVSWETARTSPPPPPPRPLRPGKHSTIRPRASPNRLPTQKQTYVRIIWTPQRGSVERKLKGRHSCSEGKSKFGWPVSLPTTRIDSEKDAAQLPDILVPTFDLATNIFGSFGYAKRGPPQKEEAALSSNNQEWELRYLFPKKRPVKQSNQKKSSHP